MIKKRLHDGPAVLPVTLTEAQTMLRNFDADLTSIIESHIKTAVAEVESFCKRRLITQTWDLILDYSIGDIPLPLGQLQGVTSITYRDSDGGVNIVDPSYYYVSGLGTDDGEIKFFDTFSFPSLYEFEPITVRFTCGYGDAGENVPESFKQAILLHVEQMFFGGQDNKETIDDILFKHVVRGK